jgi:tetratricopeptide (TPR) repeat protein
MRTCRSFVCVVVVLAVASPAAAQPSPADPKLDARSHADIATRLFDAQQYGKAAEEYQQAYLLDPQPLYLYASAQALRLDGDCTRALRSYNAYLRTSPSESDAQKTQKNIERCEQDLKDHPPVTDPTLGVPTPVTPPPPTVVSPITTPTTPIDRPATSWTSDWVGHALVGGGVLVAVTGVVLFRDGRATIEDNISAPTYGDFVAGRGDLDAAKRKQTIGVSAMAVGGALVLGGVVRYVIHGRGGSASTVSGSITPGQATLFVTRAF